MSKANKASKANSTQAGFTLIEILIAMSISAVIAVMSYQAIAQVTAVKLQTEQQNSSFTALQRTLWWMEQDFSQMVPRSIQDELGSQLPAYLVMSNEVELTRIAIAPSPHGISGLVRVGYRVENSVLYRIIWPVLDRAPDTEPRKIAVLEGVTEFSVRQLNIATESELIPHHAQGQAEWHENWPKNPDNLKELPGLVEITFKLEGFGKVRRLILGTVG